MPKRPMSAAELRRADWSAVVIVAIGSAFLLRDLFFSIGKDVPRLGLLGYLTGPVFAHKLSEILVGGIWIWAACMWNHEKADLWPSWMPRARYRRALEWTAVLALAGVVLGTYAWTVLNLGTSARTTDLVDPPGIGEEWLVWRLYLGAVVLAGCAFVVYALKKLARRE
ncbi:MAG: hypothetical protein AB7G12_06140 [Thermoanaerobaculia bacterium]